MGSVFRPNSMFSIVGLSFCFMIAGGVMGAERTNLSGIGFSLSALAAIDAWECEDAA
jgi:hypothetical protein